MNEIGIAEAVELGAVDAEFYARFFFEKTMKQSSPPFHRRMDRALDGPSRYVAFMVFRGGAKTTKVRLYLSKRIAYAISFTIVVVGKSQDHAARTVEWLMKQVEYNSKWATTFGLEKGKKWTNSECEIVHKIDGRRVRIIALGITGSTRGINVDDYRPDLILVDDPSDEENTATPEQREKTDDFINGSLRNSLAPASECPSAKLVLLQTLLHGEDSISRCAKDPAWEFISFSIFDEKGESAWGARWTTEELMKEKESFVERGKLYLWMREMECKLVDSSLSAFRSDALQYWDVLPDGMTTFLAIDPVPPPSDRELERGLKGKDWEVIAAIGRWQRRYYLIHYEMNQGHEPDWTIAKFFEFKRDYTPLKCRVESIAYQRTLKWLLEKAMQRRGEWLQMEDTKGDRRKKSYRIIDVIGSVVADRLLYVHRSHKEFIEQYFAYPNVVHDDVIETVSMGIASARDSGGIYEGEYETIMKAEADIPDLEYAGGCP